MNFMQAVLARPSKISGEQELSELANNLGDVMIKIRDRLESITEDLVKEVSKAGSDLK